MAAEAALLLHRKDLPIHFFLLRTASKHMHRKLTELMLGMTRVRTVPLKGTISALSLTTSHHSDVGPESELIYSMDQCSFQQPDIFQF